MLHNPRSDTDAAWLRCRYPMLIHHRLLELIIRWADPALKPN